ncbi:MAG: glycosyltransferase family 2 protein [Patescibacteria group bacterium]|nr:glycosyltransferase family 2 protein [Patescibacteria group bacterium]MDD5121427.1 glycosyltransferase family 2 protein [Patescibacteria group bacterium]MDD5221887.1 glycosyltransferase family 2 protein [Patescibacteria group bacterium]MDD5395654.1 glycosyltransferase family 2 protein [Patescibacteria group bacterium]
MVKVSIQIVTWNSLRFLPDCLESIFNQTFRDFSILIIDNASSDHSVGYLIRNWPQVKILKNSRNCGYARAHNQGILATDSEYVLVLNPDVILEPDFLEKIINEVDKQKKIGSFAPKLLKMKFSHIDHGEHQEQQGAGAAINPDWCVTKTDILDSTGLAIRRTRRVVDRGEGEVDKKQYDKLFDIFGVSGACVLYRRKALDDIKLKIFSHYSSAPSASRFSMGERRKSAFRNEYFDEDFHSYQEDIDLAWRLKWRNWGALYVPEAIAYHVRQVSAMKRFNKSSWVNFLSYRNHLWLLIKNEPIANFLKDIFHIFFYQSIKILYLLFTQPGVLLKAEKSFYAKQILMFKKRAQIFSRAKIKSDKIRKYIN